VPDGEVVATEFTLQVAQLLRLQVFIFMMPDIDLHEVDLHQGGIPGCPDGCGTEEDALAGLTEGKRCMFADAPVQRHAHGVAIHQQAGGIIAVLPVPEFMKTLQGPGAAVAFSSEYDLTAGLINGHAFIFISAPADGIEVVFQRTIHREYVQASLDGFGSRALEQQQPAVLAP